MYYNLAVEVSRLDMEVLKVLKVAALLQQHMDQKVHLELLAKATEVVVQASYKLVSH